MRRGDVGKLQPHFGGDGLHEFGFTDTMRAPDTNRRFFVAGFLGLEVGAEQVFGKFFNFEGIGLDSVENVIVHQFFSCKCLPGKCAVSGLAPVVSTHSTGIRAEISGFEA